MRSSLDHTCLEELRNLFLEEPYLIHLAQVIGELLLAEARAFVFS